MMKSVLILFGSATCDAAYTAITKGYSDATCTGTATWTQISSNEDLDNYASCSDITGFLENYYRQEIACDGDIVKLTMG